MLDQQPIFSQLHYKIYEIKSLNANFLFKLLNKKSNSITKSFCVFTFHWQTGKFLSNHDCHLQSWVSSKNKKWTKLQIYKKKQVLINLLSRALNLSIFSNCPSSFHEQHMLNCLQCHFTYMACITRRSDLHITKFLKKCSWNK